MKPEQRARKWIEKKAKKGVRSYPVGTIAFYGPDDSRATKVAAAILPYQDSEVTELRRWFGETGDLRKDDMVFAEIAAFLWEQDVHSVVMADGILGCPHEEGTDYPDGGVCPKCPYWAGRDRWAGKFKAY